MMPKKRQARMKPATKPKSIKGQPGKGRVPVKSKTEKGAVRG